MEQGKIMEAGVQGKKEKEKQENAIIDFSSVSASEYTVVMTKKHNREQT